MFSFIHYFITKYLKFNVFIVFKIMLSLKISILPVDSDFIAIIKVRIINCLYIKNLILKPYFVTKILAISCCHCI